MVHGHAEAENPKVSNNIQYPCFGPFQALEFSLLVIIILRSEVDEINGLKHVKGFFLIVLCSKNQWSAKSKMQHV